MGTSPEWVTLWFGLCRLGAVAVPINTAYRGDFLANQLRDSNTKMIALDRSLAERVFSIAADVPSLAAVLLREDGKRRPIPRPVPRRRTAIACQGAPDRAASRGGPLAGRRNPDLSPFPVGAIFSTSGTTGRSKGVLATQHYLLAAAQSHGRPLAAPARRGRLRPAAPLPSERGGHGAGPDAGGRHRHPRFDLQRLGDLGPGAALRGVRDRPGRGHVEHAVEPSTRRTRQGDPAPLHLRRPGAPRRASRRWRIAGSAASSPVTA